MPPAQEKKKKPPVHPEASGLILLASTFLTLLCLLSFSSGHQSHNWLGLLGYGVGWSLYFIAGLTIYPILVYLGWIGWRLLVFQKVENFGAKNLFFILCTVSISLLLNLIAECHPSLVAPLGEKVYSQSLLLQQPYPHSYTRYNLGGVPLYYLYKDLPLLNLHAMLSNFGLTLIATITALVSFLCLTQLRLLPILGKLYAFYLSKKEQKSMIPISSSPEEIEEILIERFTPKPRIQTVVKEPTQRISSKKRICSCGTKGGKWRLFDLPAPATFSFEYPKKNRRPDS